MSTRNNLRHSHKPPSVTKLTTNVYVSYANQMEVITFQVQNLTVTGVGASLGFGLHGDF